MIMILEYKINRILLYSSLKKKFFFMFPLVSNSYLNTKPKPSASKCYLYPP